MSFPLLHFFFELLAYGVGFALFRRAFRREARPFARQRETFWIAVGAILGAALGSKLVFLFQFPEFVLASFPSPEAVLGGKTIVGGLLGGVFGVEIAKMRVGLRESTGDLFTFPVLVGLAIGRVGCLLAGLGDETFGGPTRLPWGWDFGDGVSRHPAPLYEIALLLVLGLVLRVLAPHLTQAGDGVPRHPAPLYEIAFLLVFALALRALATRLVHAGDSFRVFMAAYLAFRVAIDFLKPPFTAVASAAEAALPRPHLYGFFTAIQIAALAGLLYYAAVFLRRGRRAP